VVRFALIAVVCLLAAATPSGAQDAQLFPSLAEPGRGRQQPPAEPVLDSLARAFREASEALDRALAASEDLASSVRRGEGGRGDASLGVRPEEPPLER